MKVKLGNLRVITENLCLQREKRFPVKVAYAIVKNIEILKKEFETFERMRIEVCEKYSAKDDNGKPIVKDRTYDIPGNKKQDFDAELRELADEEIDIDIRMVSISEFEKCDTTDRYDIPTGEDLSILNFMLKE